MKDRLLYTFNWSTQAGRSNYSSKRNKQETQHHHLLHASWWVNHNKEKQEVRVQVGTYEHEKQYRWQQEQHQPACEQPVHAILWYSTSVQHMSCNGTAPVYSTCHATIQHQCDAASACAVVQYLSRCLTKVKQQYLHTSSHGAVQCDWHSTIRCSVIVEWRVDATTTLSRAFSLWNMP